MRLAWVAVVLTIPACGGPASPTDGPTPAPTPTPNPAVCAPGDYLDEVFADPVVRQNVLYSEVSDAFGSHKLRMDIYEPNGDLSARRPAIVWIHGGTFKTGNKDQLREFAREFARRGYVTAAIEYRLLRKYVPNAKLAPAAEIAQADAQAAIRYLRANAADLALDPARIGIAGYSAGSITAFNVGYRYEFAGDNLDNAGQPHTVAAVMGMDGFIVTPADLRSGDPAFILFRSALSSDEDDPNAIPNLLAAADSLGIPREDHVVQGATHLNIFKPPYSQTIVAQAAPFLRSFVGCR